MNTNKKPLKAIALSLGLAAMMLLATNLDAQSRPSGLFGNKPVQEEKENGLMQRGNRSTISDNGLFTNGNFGENVPLGGGIAVLLAAGLGYVALKKKEDKQ